MPERRSDPATQVCPVTGAGRRGLLLFQPSAPRGSSPRPPVRLAPNGGSLCVLEAGTRPFLRILAIYSPILSASLRLVKNFYCQFSTPGAYWPLAEGTAGEDTRPYEHTGSCPVNAVGAGDLGGPRAHNVRPYREKKEACRVRTGAPTLGGRHCGRGKPLPYGSQESLPELGRGGPWASRRPRTSRH